GVRDLHLSIRVDREGVGTPEEVIAASIRGCKEAQAIAGSYLKGKFSAKLLIAFGRERKENSPDDIKPILEAVMKLKTGDIENIAGFDITGGEFIIGDEAVNPVYRKTSDYLRVIQDTVPAGILSTMRVTSHLGDWGHTYKSTKKLGRNGTELSDIPDVNERIGHHLAFIEDALNSGVLTDIQHGTVLAPADSLITKDPRKSNGGKYAGTRMGDIKGIDDNLIRIGRLLGDLKTRGLEINTCPTINCMSQKISLYKGHPLHQWIVKGNKVSINADDLYTSIPTTLSDDIVKMMLTAPERSDGRFLSPAMAREISAPRGAGSLAEVAKALPAAAAANPAPAGNMQALPREPIRSPYIISSGTDWTTIFDDNTKPIVVEVGFGGGRELLEMAKKNPQINYIGIDANIRMVNVLSFLLEDEADEGRPISNLKVVCTSDYEEFAVQTKNDIVSEMYYIYKDPRSPTALTYSDGFRDMARILKPGGKVFMSAADDVLSTVKDETPVLGSGYLAETMLLLFKEHGFEDVTKDSKFPHPSDSYPEKESVKAVFRKPPAAQLANGIEGASKTSRNTLYIDFSDIDADKFKAIVLKTKGAELSAAAQLSMNAFCEIIPKLYKVKSKWQKDPFYPQVCFFTGYSHDIEKILYANKVPFKSVSRRDFMWPQSSLFPEDRGIYELWADDREADHFHKYFIITVAGIDFVLDLTADQFVMEKGEYPDLGVFMIPVSMLTKCAWPYAGGQEFVESGNSSPADVAKAPPAAARRAQAGLVDSSQLTVDSKGEQGNAPGTRLTFLDILRTTKERLVSCVKSASYSPDDIPPAPGYDLPHDTFKPLVDAYGFLVTEIELDVEHEPDVVLLLAGKRDEYLNRINEHIKAINALRKSIIANRTLKQEYRLRLIGDDGFVSKAIEILNELKDFLDQYYNNEPPAAESLRGAGSPAELLKTPPAAVAADPTDLVAGLTKAQRQELKAKFKSVPGYDRIRRNTKGMAVAFYYILKAAQALEERGAKIEEFEKRFIAGDYNMAGLPENDRKLVGERTALDADIPHPKVSRSQKARYLVFAALTGRKVILVTEAPIRGYPIQEIVPVGQEGSLYLLSLSKNPFESQLKIIKNNRILMRSALNKRVGILLGEKKRVLVDAGIFVPVKHKPGYYRFADMMMNKGSDAEYTATLINVLEDVDYSLPIADLREFVKMAIISEMEKEFAVPDKKVMWHIIERDVIPEGQRSTLIQAVNNKFDRDNNGFERIRILRENETIAGAIAEIRSKDQDAIIDAALSDVSHIDAVGDEEVKKMVFTLEQGTEFIQLEGVLKALRALHYDDSQETWRVLARLYSAMSGTASQAHFYMNKDGVYVFNLPKINRENINDFSKLNERLLELLTAA
ncbi:MAG: hypothetical protein NTY34_02980, partial [Candidatus Omnitrophica bacterium]|nr:hypothetical protein [Candidatus Omnitrophota bacterium]